MKTFIVALISLFDNDLKQFKIEADSEYEALKEGMRKLCTTEESKQSEIEYQESEAYPTNYEDLVDGLAEQDVMSSVIEI